VKKRAVTLLCVLVVFTACGNHQDDSENYKAHQHAEAAHQYTENEAAEETNERAEYSPLNHTTPKGQTERRPVIVNGEQIYVDFYWSYDQHVFSHMALQPIIEALEITISWDRDTGFMFMDNPLGEGAVLMQLGLNEFVVDGEIHTLNLPILLRDTTNQIYAPWQFFWRVLGAQVHYNRAGLLTVTTIPLFVILENGTRVDTRIEDEVADVILHHFQAIEDGDIMAFRETLQGQDGASMNWHRSMIFRHFLDIVVGDYSDEDIWWGYADIDVTALGEQRLFYEELPPAPRNTGLRVLEIAFGDEWSLLGVTTIDDSGQEIHWQMGILWDFDWPGIEWNWQIHD